MQTGATGEDIYRWGLNVSEFAALDLSEEGADWARGHLHELVEHLSEGGTLPFKTKMKGGAAATLISNQGHLITNHHLVSGIHHFHGLQERTVAPRGGYDAFSFGQNFSGYGFGNGAIVLRRCLYRPRDIEIGCHAQSKTGSSSADTSRAPRAGMALGLPADDSSSQRTPLILWVPKR